MTDNPNHNKKIIKYCLPLAAVSFIIFLCGFFSDNIVKASLWAATIFIFLSSLVIYCYTVEKLTSQNHREIEVLKQEKEKLNNLHYYLHLINPSFNIGKKVSLSLKILLEFIPDATFVCYYYNEKKLDLISACKTNSSQQPEDVAFDDSIIEDITLRIKTLTDYDSLKKSVGLDKPLIISNGRYIQGQLVSINLFTEVIGILAIVGKNNFSSFENRLIREFSNSLALIFNDNSIFEKTIKKE